MEARKNGDGSRERILRCRRERMEMCRQEKVEMPAGKNGDTSSREEERTETRGAGKRKKRKRGLVSNHECLLMAPVDSEPHPLSGFKRILLRLDEPTRRKYCCQAVEEELEHVQTQLQSCLAAMANVKQVHDATLKLNPTTTPCAAISSERVATLDALRTRLEKAVHTLCKAHTDALGTASDASPGRVKTKEIEEEDTGDDHRATTRAGQARKLVAKQIVSSHELETVVRGIRQLERLMPDAWPDDEHEERTWWTKHVVQVVAHALNLFQGKEDAQAQRLRLRLTKSMKKMVDKCPELEPWHAYVLKQLTAQAHVAVPPVTKAKKKRARTLSHDAMEAPHAPSSSPDPKASATTQSSPSPAREKALLQLCAREVRTLRDKFELGAYDVNLSRMVTIVDSLWTGVEPSDVNVLATTLFTLVETVEKVVALEKRRDRFICLESVLRVVLGSPKLPLTPRWKTMIEEYAHNCRQSLEQLPCPATTRSAASKSGSGPEQATAPLRPGARRSSETAGFRPPHVRFN
ncbi:hypothetical protein PsorP6_016824 [Peronosclerospora sorghi]|uniref:Uncharacterized protein n=1 Tax=Peronosclerospora sorghi TaxID=230839 RepID=A0ACC0WEI1_9STRA|nr:hypothetical protein PsorP6_016824 [Peronosclerospora sorghi]